MSLVALKLTAISDSWIKEISDSIKDHEPVVISKFVNQTIYFTKSYRKGLKLI